MVSSRKTTFIALSLGLLASLPLLLSPQAHAVTVTSDTGTQTYDYSYTGACETFTAPYDAVY